MRSTISQRSRASVAIETCGSTSTARTEPPPCCPSRYRERLASLALADSVALDPHKWLYVPVEAGLVLVRDGAQLRSTFSLVPPYLRTDGDPRGVGGPPWLSEFGFQQSRGFRALKVWMTLKYYGTTGYARAIDHDLALASYLADRVNADAGPGTDGAALTERRLFLRECLREWWGMNV